MGRLPAPAEEWGLGAASGQEHGLGQGHKAPDLGTDTHPRLQGPVLLDLLSSLCKCCVPQGGTGPLSTQGRCPHQLVLES